MSRDNALPLDLTGRVTVASYTRGSSNDIIIGTFDQKEVALHRPRALVDTQEVRDLFRRNVAIWAPLFHRNVVKVHGMVYNNNDVYFVTDWLESDDMSTYLRNSSDLDRLSLLSGVAAGLEYLHDNGIIHGDVRAVNVSVSRDVARVARLCNYFEFLEGDINPGPSNSDVLRWTAPEVLKGRAVSMGSDVWGFGMFCLEVMTGDVPFNGKTDDQVRHQLGQGKHPGRSHGLTNDIWKLMRCCWHKDPERRLSMTGVKAAIGNITERHKSTNSSFFFHFKGSRPGTATTDNTSVISTTHLERQPSYSEEPPKYNQTVSRNLNGSDQGSSTSGHERFLNVFSKKKFVLTFTPSRASSIGKQSSKSNPSVSCPVLAYQSSSSSSFISEGELFSPRTVIPRSAEPSDVIPFPFDTRIRPLVLNVVDGVILSGTLEGLTNSLINFGLQGCRDFFDTFFMGCTDFTTPEDLFDYLSHRFFEVEIDENIKSEERITTQMSIINIIKFWIEDGKFTPSEELSQKMIDRCKMAIQVKTPVPTVADKMRNLLQIIETQIENRHTTPIMPEIRGPIPISSQIAPRDLAIGLTLLEGDLFRSLQPTDYMAHLTTGLSDNIIKITKTKSKIRAWVIDRILHYDTPEWRAGVLRFFIDTAIKCLELKNFSSWITIAFAVHSDPMNNLEVTRKALNSGMMKELSALHDIINADSNYQCFRAAINRITSPERSNICVPWLDTHFVDLRGILDKHPVTVRVGDNDLINFERYTKFMDRIKEVAHCTPPELTEYRDTGQLEYLLDSLSKLPFSNNNEDALLARSLHLKAQEKRDFVSRKFVFGSLGFVIPNL